MSPELKKLYEAKTILIDEVQSLSKVVGARSNARATAEESARMKVVDTELEEIGRSIDFQIRADQNSIEKQVRAIKSNTSETPEENFQLNGKELPIFNSRNRTSVKDWVDKENPVEEDLKGMTFGKVARAYLFGPKNELEERALAEGTDSTGGYTTSEFVGADFVDRLRPQSRVMQAGAQVVMLDSGNFNKFSMAKLVNGLTVQWLAEGSQQTPADPSFGQVLWNFHTARAMVRVSNELLQDSVNIERVLTQESTKAFASELDRVALVGSGTGAEIAGIKTYANAPYVSMAGAGGASPASYDEVIALIAELQTNNVDIDGNISAIMHPRTLAGYNILKDTVNDQPLQRPNYIANMPFLQTTAVPVTDTYGTSSVASKLFIGDWSQLFIGMRLGITIQPLKERYADFNETCFMVVMRADIQPYHQQAFGYIRGILGASLPT